MAAPAQNPIQAVPPTGDLAAGLTHEGPTPDYAQMHAIIACPQDTQSVERFLDTLGHVDPSLPRSNDLTTALIAALSAFDINVGKAEVFAQQSLRFEIEALLENGEDNIAFPPETLSLITAFLHHRRIGCLFLENILMSLRKSLLTVAQTGAAVGKDNIQLAEAMARHSFLTEYIWDETDAEQKTVAELVNKTCDHIEAGAAVCAFDLFMIAAYRPLYNLDAVRTWVRNLALHNLSALDSTLRLLVFDPLLEAETSVEAITPVTSLVSKEVQSQYEENPYPRWRHMPAVIEFNEVEPYVAASTRRHNPVPKLQPQRAKVLIAGAGTGKHPILVAKSLPNAAVLAIDLSRASLAYGIREAEARGVRNVAFAQADIQKLAEVDVAFDLIESVGVLHHMEDPEAGLQALLKVLKPGGCLRLGLYSKTARHAVYAARSKLTDTEYAPGLSGLRAFRRALIRSDDAGLARLRTIPDFYSASEFRDLVMHVQEHQFTLGQISGMLKRNGLEFLGFTNQSAHAALLKMPPQVARERVCDLKAWAKYEKQNPDTFIGMYDFFCVKR